MYLLSSRKVFIVSSHSFPCDIVCSVMYKENYAIIMSVSDTNPLYNRLDPTLYFAQTESGCKLRGFIPIPKESSIW